MVRRVAFAGNPQRAPALVVLGCGRRLGNRLKQFEHGNLLDRGAAQRTTRRIGKNLPQSHPAHIGNRNPCVINKVEMIRT